MANALLRLPQFQWGDAGRVDFSPINQAVEFWNRRQQQDIQNKRADEQLGLQRAAGGRQQQAFDEQQRQAKIAELGRMAGYADSLKDDTQRRQVWGQIVGSDPNMAAALSKYGLDPNDHINGPRFLRAQAGQYDPQGEAERQARLGLIQAQTGAANRGAEPEIVRQLRAAGVDPASPQGRQIIMEQVRGQNPIDQAIGGMLRGAIGGQPQPGAQPPAAGGVAPMSAPGGAPQPQMVPAQAPVSDPNIIRTQTAAPGAQQPSPVAGSMFADLSPDQKRRMAEAFLLSPRTKALGEQMIKDIEAEGLGKKTRDEVATKEFAASETLASLKSIRDQFKPEYQTIPYKIRMSLAAWQEKLSTNPNSIDPKTKQQLTDFTRYRVNAFRAINDYIRSVTGAQMSEPEAKRIRKGIPDPGDEILSGDSPTELKAKLDRVMKDVRTSMMRYAYAKATGRPWQSIPLEAMRAIVQRRGTELLGQMRSQGVPSEQLQQRVKVQLRQEFGGDI